MKGIIQAIRAMVQRPKEDDFEIKISRNKLRALMQSYDDNVQLALEQQKVIRTDYTEFKADLITRMKTLEGKYGDARKVLVAKEQECEELRTANEELTAQLTEHNNPEASPEAEAAREFIRWGYTEQQLEAILKLAKDNEQLLMHAAEGEDGEPLPLVEVMRKNRFLIELALRNHGIVKPTETTAVHNGALPGLDKLGKGF